MFMNNISHRLNMFKLQHKHNLMNKITLIKVGLSFNDAQRRILSTPTCKIIIVQESYQIKIVRLTLLARCPAYSWSSSNKVSI